MNKLMIFAIALTAVGFVHGDFCPDQSRCQSTQTCCATGGGKYACCPYSGAVCCSDQRHCCPSNTACDLAHGRCTPARPIQYPFYESSWTDLENEDLTDSNELVKKVCPDGKQKCPDTYTCCGTSFGGSTGYACCPLQNAVCCTDGVHCCPAGRKCNLTSGKCEF